MGFKRQPRLARPFGPAFQRPQNAFRSGHFTADRGHRHPSFADAKEGTQVSITGLVKDDTLAILVVGDPFTRLELSIGFHAATSGNSQVKQARGLAAFAQKNHLRVLVCLAPQDATEGEQVVTMRCRAAPLDGVRGGMKLDAPLTGG